MLGIVRKIRLTRVLLSVAALAAIAASVLAAIAVSMAMKTMKSMPARDRFEASVRAVQQFERSSGADSRGMSCVEAVAQTSDAETMRSLAGRTPWTLIPTQMPAYVNCYPALRKGEAGAPIPVDAKQSNQILKQARDTLQAYETLFSSALSGATDCTIIDKIYGGVRARRAMFESALLNFAREERASYPQLKKYLAKGCG